MKKEGEWITALIAFEVLITFTLIAVWQFAQTSPLKNLEASLGSLKPGIQEDYSAMEETCTDSDGGIDYYVKGVVNYPGAPIPQEDSCCMHCYTPPSYGGIWLSEMYCKNESTGTRNITECEYGCEDGICLSAQKDWIIEETNLSLCEVSGDRINYSFESGGGGNTYIKGCIGNDNVVEHKCEGNSLLMNLTQCPMGELCQDGVCNATESCTDSDEGTDIYEKGNIRYFYDNINDFFYGWHESYDSCVSEENILLEFSCEFYDPQELFPYENYYCPEGCSDDKCLGSETNQTCYDSDNGKDYFYPGWINEANGHILDDFCYNESLLVEYFCGEQKGIFENNATQENHSCENGCSGGSCIISCTSDADCTYLTGACGIGKCHSTRGYCYASYNTTTDSCRSNASECDAMEYCSGSSTICSNDINKSDGTACSAGICQGGTCITSICANDTGCSSAGSFCQGNMPYNCTLNVSDGCLDRKNSTVCASGYSCSSGVCEADDVTPTPNNPPGPTPIKLCATNWNCTWSACVNNIQTYNCVDKNRCGTTSGRPGSHGTTKACTASKDCVDNDKDGYGVGKDCLGADIDDNNSSITDTLPSTEVETPGTTGGKIKEFLGKNLFYITAGLIALALIVAIIISIIVIVKAFKKPAGKIEISEKKIKGKNRKFE